MLENSIQQYAWGSVDGIPSITGMSNPENNPFAELWLGAHPAAPSRLVHAGESLALDSFIAMHPVETLGKTVNLLFDSKLPYLLKILSAVTPLSLQVHPSKSQAEAGFKRENDEHIPITAFNRNYKDNNHKPEIILALTSFKAMAGFRNIDDILSLFSAASISEVADILQNMSKSRSYSAFYQDILHIEQDKKQSICSTLASKAKELSLSHPDRSVRRAFAFVTILAETYPDDTGIFAPLYLNCIELEPLQAMYLPAGIMHAYVHGTGIELMANSDNVLRGGLTPKYIDIDELCSILREEPFCPEIFTTDPGSTQSIYATPCKDFELSRLNLQNNSIVSHSFGPRILLCTDGHVDISGVNELISLTKGKSAFIPANAGKLTLSGSGVVFSAAVPET